MNRRNGNGSRQLDKKEAKALFRESDRLFKAGDYLEALQHLATLHHYFPEDFNVAYAMLLCRERLGRMEEARERCTEMLEHCHDPKQRNKLTRTYTRLCQGGEAPPEGIQAKDSVFNNAGPPGRYHLQAEPDEIIQVRGRWIVWKDMLAALVIVCVILAALLTLPLLIRRVAPGGDAENPALFLALRLALLYALNCVAFYLALWLSGKHVHDDLLRDILEACVLVPLFFFMLVGSFWWVRAFRFVEERYDMSGAECAVFMVTTAVVNGLFLYFFLWDVFGETVWEFMRDY